MATYNIDEAQGKTLENGDVILCPYSGSIKSLELKRGKYKFECWGACGGNGKDSYRAVGGYSYGDYEINNARETLYFVSGGAGSDAHENVPSPGGYNGGGTGNSHGTGWLATYSGGGGGATHIGLLNSLLTEYSSTYISNLIIVGGGAGGSLGTYTYGGKGGGTAGGDGQGSDGGKGGTQTAGGASSDTKGTSGVFGAGGYITDFSVGRSGGGGGFFGGGIGTSGGGGGSGYISATLLTNAATTQQSSSTTPDGSLNGYIRITILEIYKPVEVPYIESRGTEWIDLGTNFNSTTDRIEIVYQPTENPNDELIGGGNYQSVEGEFYFGDGGHNGEMIALFGQNGAFSTGTVPVDTSKFQTFLYANNKVYVDGVLIMTNTQTINTQYNLILFGLNRITPMGLGYYRVHRATIWRNDTLYKDFVAAEYNGVFGLWERLTDTFLYTASGTLIGPNIHGYIGINGVARRLLHGYVGVNGVAKKLVKGYIGVNGVARRIFDVGSHTLTNLLSTANMTISGATLSEGVFTYPAGVFCMITQPLPVPIVGHKYYGRVDQKVPAGTTFGDGRFEYFGGDGTGNNIIFTAFDSAIMDNEWHTYSEIQSFPYITGSNWTLRSFTVSGSNTVYRRNHMIIDLTGEFGAGNEPSKEWCDENIPYFEGSITI